MGISSYLLKCIIVQVMTINDTANCFAEVVQG
jgi:hypothetical protein